jgi:hypothetical protein
LRWFSPLFWAGVAAAYALVLGVCVALALYLAPGPVDAQFVMPAQSTPPCPLQPTGAARCVTIAECFDAVNVVGGVASARKVACADPHVWETFAQADLPDGLDTATHSRIKQNAEVREVCSQANVRRLNPETWQVEVLPPTRDQVDSGDRTYRCLAGRPPARFTSSRFGH